MSSRCPLLLGAPLGPSQATEVPPGAAEVGSDLPYPPPKSPQPDEIAHVPTGLRVSFDDMMEMVSGARLVFVGETHDNFQAHRVQLEIIRDLERRFPAGSRSAWRCSASRNRKRSIAGARAG